MEDPAQYLPNFVITFVIVVLSIAYHELGHAVTALAFGDDTAKQHGRITLNPIKHLDPTGTLMILFLGFGWGQTPVSPERFRGNKRLASALVALVGPTSNFLIAIIAALVYRLSPELPGRVEDAVLTALYINLMLTFFNLFPIAPLDGFKVVGGLLPRKIGEQWEQMAVWGPGILYVIIGLGAVTQFSPLTRILGPLVRGTTRFLLYASPF